MTVVVTATAAVVATVAIALPKVAVTAVPKRWWPWWIAKWWHPQRWTRRRGRGRGDAPSGGGRGSQQPWLGYFVPMGMPFPPPRTPWIPPNSAGILGPRPGAPNHAYPVMQPSTPLVPYSVTPYSWDTAAMYHDAPSYGSAFPPHTDWIMDTGASSHVTRDQVPCSSLILY